MMFFIIGVIVFGIVVLVGLSRFAPRRTAKLNHVYFEEQWATLLARVKTPEGMILAVVDADKLLDEALKRHHFKGKTMGERLVSAQRMISDNDAVWYMSRTSGLRSARPKTRWPVLNADSMI